jgi:hypothetical protein
MSIDTLKSNRSALPNGKKAMHSILKQKKQKWLKTKEDTVRINRFDV